MKAKVFGFALFAAFLVEGCTTEAPPSPPIYYSVRVISDPPGARIEINDNYVGDAPVSIQLPGSINRMRSGVDIKIRALPIVAGQYTQTKYILGGIGNYNKTVPDTIFFDMHLEPMRDQIDVNLNKN